MSTAQGDKPPGSPGFSDAHNCPVLINPVLSFIKAFRLKGDNETLKGIVVERFSSAAVESAKAMLWNSCESHLLSGGLEFHNRRHSDKRSQFDANLNDLLQAFQRLDTSDNIPPIYYETFDLLKLPLTSSIENLSQKLTSHVFNNHLQ